MCEYDQANHEVQIIFTVWNEFLTWTLELTVKDGGSKNFKLWPP